jgi:hypothetical protein
MRLRTEAIVKTLNHIVVMKVPWQRMSLATEVHSAQLLYILR